MISFAAIKTEVIARLGNRTDITSRVERWINYGWFELLLNPRFSFFELDIILNPFTTTVAGTLSYTIPADLWFLLDVTDTTNSRKIRRVSYAMIDNQFPTSGQPTRYYRFANTMNFDPIPDLAYDIQLRYRKRPNDLSAGSDLLIGTEWEELIAALSVKKGYDALGLKEEAAAELQIVEQMMQTRYDVPNLEDADSEPTLSTEDEILMSDLTTIDPTQPLDTELASLGASRIREERAGIVGFAGIEHFLTGVHKFLSGTTASRPAPGNAGRLYMNTSNGSVEQDTGSAWQRLKTGNPQYNINATTFVYPAGVPINSLNINFFASAGCTVVMLAAVRLVNATALNQTIRILMGVDGVPVSLGDGDPFLLSVGRSTATCWGYLPNPLSEGGHSTGITCTANPGNITHEFSQLLLFML